jgi:ATP-dependent DNA helicase RecG
MFLARLQMMNEEEQLKKLEELLNLPNETEWVELKTAKADYDFEKLGKYLSAVSNEANLHNEAAGWIIFGADKSHRVVGTRFKQARSELEKLKHDIAQHTTLNITFRHTYEISHPQGRVLIFEVTPAPHGIPVAWKGHWYGRDGESLVALKPDEYEAIRSQTKPDWSIGLVPEASLKDLDSQAILLARAKFAEKYPDLVTELRHWDDLTFLNKSKITRNGKITRAALILLGKAESSHWLSPADVRITWVSRDGDFQDYVHFYPPYLVNSDVLYKKIRNPLYQFMTDRTLFPDETLKYDAWVVRELLHNCIAHQDYELNGRINVVEDESSLTFTNLGSFIPMSVERVIEMDMPPDRYRNRFLAEAMVNIKMIDTIGSGIKRIFRTQRKRGFPMPDYDLTEPDRVKATIIGRIIDENYTRMLLLNNEVTLSDAISLDKVQKRRPISEDEFKSLKKKELIEGRRPLLYVSAKIAKATGREVEYVLSSGMDDSHYKELVLKLIRNFEKATPSQIQALLLEKLPKIMNEEQKKDKIRNLVQEMSKIDGSIQNIGKRGKGAVWTLRI